MLPTASVAEEDEPGADATGGGTEAEDVPKSGLVSALIALSYVGVSILEPEIGTNFVFADFAIGLVFLVAILGLHVRGSRSTATAVRAAPWLWLVLLGSAMGLWGVGVPSWAISSLLRTVMAIGAFFLFWYVIDIRHAERPAIIGTAIGLTLNVTRSFTGAAGRASGYLGSPNYLGHYAALAGVLLFLTSRKRWAKVASLVLLGYGVYLSASFGAIAMVIVAVIVWLVRVAARNSGVLAGMLIAFAAISIFLSLASTSLSVDSDAELTPTISQQRFERSQGSRLELWGKAWDGFTSQPTGVGPDGVKNREIAVFRSHAAEIHSDAFGYLVERSIPGFLGYLGLWSTIWVASRRGGIARVLIPMILVAGLFRETMHFRHAWLLLALAFVVDYRRLDEERELPEPEDEPATGLATA